MKTRSTLGLTSLGALGAVVMLAGACVDEPVVVTPIGNAPVQLESPAAITGGSLAVLADLNRAVIADTDMDQIVVVDIASMEVAHTIALDPGDEPGRVVAGPAGQAYVALRRGGDVVAVNVQSGETTRRAVCAAPRGMAYEAAGDLLHVACAGGELLTLNADLSGEPVREIKLANDLRDVVLSNGKLLVSRFRAAEVLAVGNDGSVTGSGQPHVFNSFRLFSGSVAWKMVALPGGQAMMLHQRGTLDEVSIAPPVMENEEPVESSYGGGGGDDFCIPGIVHAAVSFFNEAGDNIGEPEMGGIGDIVLAVDADVAPAGDRLAVVGAGSDVVFTTSLDRARHSDRMNEGCFLGFEDTEVVVPGEPVAVGYASDGTLFVQTRQPAMLKRIRAETGEVLSEVRMPGPDRRNWGHALFHKAASPNSAIACASCHPEGRDDGRVWLFSDIGARRTQSMSGGVLNTLPLHWDGDMTDLHQLMGEVFVNRMGGATQPQDRIDAMAEWMNGVKVVPASTPFDTDAVARGEELFTSPNIGCASCHNGDMYTNNATADVNTGKAFQVPALVGIAHRAPFMHNGCAPTLRDRFTNPSCGGGDAHGKTSQLNDQQINDLVAYLETL